MKNRLFAHPYSIPQTLELIRLGMKDPRLPSIGGTLEFRPRPLRVPKVDCSNYPQRRGQFDRSHRRLRWFGTALLAWVAAACFLLLGSTPLLAQQCCPDTGPIKWEQPPNLQSNITVNASQGLTLADDFLCTNSGPIIDIHLWGGWLNDVIDPNAVFTLGIWSDVPAVTNGPAPIPSHPGQLLWSQPFGPGQYTQCPFTSNGGPFFDPRVPGDIGGMQNLYYLCFSPANPFVQLGTTASPTNYWLSLSVQTAAGANALFGWRDSQTSYNDTAVWVQGPPPPPGAWNELKGDAPFYRALNMAFKVITSTNQPPPTCVETNAVKYIQPPSLDGGFDVWDNGPWVLADDFNCTTTGPITDIHLWGSWLNNIFEPNQAFWLGIYDDVPKTTNADGTISPSHPGNLKWEQWFGPGQYSVVPAGMDADQFLDPGPPAIQGSDSQAFYYCFYPTNPFVQLGTTTQPLVYWLAAYNSFPLGTNNFGWKSSTVLSNDVSVFGPWPGGAPPNPWNWQPTFTPGGIPLDLAFKISTATNQCPSPVLLCSNQVVECGTTWTLTPPLVIDPCCGTNVVVTALGAVTNGMCPQVITVTWQATDCRGQTATCTQSITVVDTTPPVLVCGTNKTVQCGSSWTFDTPSAFDLCCTNVAVTIAGTVTNGTCPEYITRTWLATDCCGNTNTCSQTVTVVNTTPPVITCPPDRTVECGSGWTFEPPTAYSACCGSNVSVFLYSVFTNGVCPKGITINWAAVDCCNNTNMCSQIVTIVDTTPPVVICGPNKTVECGSTGPVFDVPTVSDNCCTNVRVSVLGTVTNGTCPQVLTRTWLAQDCCGNTNTCSQTVTIVDTTPPVIYCVTNKTVRCGDTWTFDTPFATDNCCTNVAVSVLDTVTNGLCPQFITRTWVARDCCGNTNTCSQTVTVVNDIPPVLTCATNKTVECGSSWTFDPPTGYALCCGTNLNILVLGTFTNGAPCAQVMTRFWEAIDCCGNTNVCSQTVQVVDTTPPVLSCSPAKTVECGSAWTFDPPTAFDACCGTNVTVSVLGTVTNGLCPQTATRTWLAVDCCTNRAVCSQTVTIVDTTPPVIHCPSNIVVQTCNSNIVVNWTVTATDACSTNVSITCTPLSGSTFGRDTTNHIHCVATDPCGNSNTCDFLVIVERPSLTLTVVHNGGQITLTWTDGVLQEADTPLGPWTDVPGAISPYTTSNGHPHKFYRLRCP